MIAICLSYCKVQLAHIYMMCMFVPIDQERGIRVHNV